MSSALFLPPSGERDPAGPVARCWMVSTALLVEFDAEGEILSVHGRFPGLTSDSERGLGMRLLDVFEDYLDELALPFARAQIGQHASTRLTLAGMEADVSFWPLSAESHGLMLVVPAAAALPAPVHYGPLRAVSGTPPKIAPAGFIHGEDIGASAGGAASQPVIPAPPPSAPPVPAAAPSAEARTIAPATDLRSEMLAEEPDLQDRVGGLRELFVWAEPDDLRVTTPREAIRDLLERMVDLATGTVPVGGTACLTAWKTQLEPDAAAEFGIAPGRYVRLQLSMDGTPAESPAEIERDLAATVHRECAATSVVIEDDSTRAHVLLAAV
ncbi:MAG: hypothetical protein WC273_11305 [Dehalococcoidia bacterium]